MKHLLVTLVAVCSLGLAAGAFADSHCGYGSSCGSSQCGSSSGCGDGDNDSCGSGCGDCGSDG